MKKLLLVLVALSVMLVAGDMKKPMKNFRMVTMDKAQIVQSGKAKMFCPKCGMTLPMFYRTNHAAKFDGKTYQYCSIHCMLEDALERGVEPTDPMVVDNSTLKFISVNDAYYVVGSKKPATMSMVSKYAFGTKKAAQDFAKKFGGKVMRYPEVAALVEKNMKKEIAGIHKRQAKMAKMGAKIYKKMCKPTDKRFKTAAEAKVFMKSTKLCGNIKGKQCQAVALFLAGKGK